MNVVMGSLWRNSAGRVDRYLNQVALLRDRLDEHTYLRLIGVEGDSYDRTRDNLLEGAFNRGIPIDLVTCNHGQKEFGSTEETPRMVALSKVVNTLVEAVREEDDIFVYVESDLVWEASAIEGLIELARREEEGVNVFAPYLAAGEYFYDIWGYRKLNGERFSPFYKGGPPEEVSSVGSCMAMKAHIARSSRVRNDYALVGFCQDIRSQGFRIAVHPAFKVNHP